MDLPCATRIMPVRFFMIPLLSRCRQSGNNKSLSTERLQ